jgi:outer membrane protein assembly factor BamD
MHSAYRRTTAIIAALAVLATVGGCASNRTRSKANTAYIARDVDTLYATAKDRLDRRQYTLAAAPLFGLGPPRPVDERVQLLHVA